MAEIQFKAKRDIDIDVGPILDRIDRLSAGVVDRVSMKALRGQIKLIETAERNLTARNSTYEQSDDSRRRGHRTVSRAMAIAVGSKTKKLNANTVTAKAGFSVGKQKPGNRTATQGVGISKANAQWFGLGTKSRATGSRKSGKRQKVTGKPVRRRGGVVPLEPSFRSLDASAKVLDQLARREMEAEVTRLANS